MYHVGFGFGSSILRNPRYQNYVKTGTFEPTKTNTVNTLANNAIAKSLSPPPSISPPSITDLESSPPTPKKNVVNWNNSVQVVLIPSRPEYEEAQGNLEIVFHKDSLDEIKPKLDPSTIITQIADSHFMLATSRAPTSLSNLIYWKKDEENPENCDYARFKREAIDDLKKFMTENKVDGKTALKRLYQPEEI